MFSWTEPPEILSQVSHRHLSCNDESVA
jgi:hypothetical protein